MNLKLQQKAERIASKLVNKTIGRQLLKMPLSEQVKVARRLMRQQGLINFRSSLLKDTGMPDDIRDFAKKGMTQTDIKAYYWNCPEFVEFWSRDLEMTEYQLDLLIETSLTTH